MSRWLNSKDGFDGDMSLEMYYIYILDQLIYSANAHGIHYRPGNCIGLVKVAD